MNSMTKEEYLKLLDEIDNEDQDENLDIPDESWIWAEPPIKQKIKHNTLNSMVNLTTCRKDKIQEALYKCMNIQVGNYLIRISSYHGEPDKFGNGTGLTMDICVWEKRYKTLSGNPCNMDYMVDLSKDNRFTNQPWLKLFDGYYAKSVPVDTVVDIVRWMQALKRMTAFL